MDPLPARAVLPESAAVQRALFSAYPDALLLADAAGRIVLANPAAERMLGYGAGELDGVSVETLVPAAIRPRHAAYREAYNRDPRPRPMGTQTELVAQKRDGSEVMVEIALSPLAIEGRAYVVAAVRDIEAYPRIRQALQRARYSEFVARMGRLAVDARDPQQLLQQVPAVAADALQADAALVYLLEPNRLEFRIAGGVGLAEDERPGLMLPNRADTLPGWLLREGRPLAVGDLHTETRFQVPPAWLAPGPVSALAVPLTDLGQIVGALVLRSRQPARFGADELHCLEALSNLLAASLQRARGEAALQHSQRLESVGQLTGGIAHDFNNLLTVIQGNLQVLEDHPALAADAGAREMLAAAMRASRRGAELTGKLLAFSRRQRLAPEEVEVGELLESLAGMLRRTLDQRIRIELDAAPGLRCRVDPGQLESALLNIAINSRDAMPQGGRLVFTARRCTAPPEGVAAELPAGEALAEIAIADSGEGMSEAVRERAFEPFFTTKELGRGTGLGLSTVYGFVKQSRGAIRLRSAPGEGTEVVLYLPLAEAALPGAAAGAAGPALPPGLAVLLVEDEDEVRAVVQRFLEALGCRVAAVASGEAALAALEAGAACDLLLSDIALGAGLRGTALADRMPALRPQARVLLMSGFAPELLHGEAGGALPAPLLRKPFGRDELAVAVAAVLARR